MRIVKIVLATAIALPLTIVSMSSASAQSAVQPDELKAVYACKSISNAQERLACYDSSVGRFEAAQKSGEVVTVSKTAIERVERDAFGFNLPSLPSLGRMFGNNNKDKTKPSKSAKENDLTAPVKQASRPTTAKSSKKPPVTNERPTPSNVTEVSLEIRKTTEFGYKKTRFFMANGQVWEQVNSKSIRIPKTRGDKVNIANISKASLGSFFLRVNGTGSATRVRRVR